MKIDPREWYGPDYWLGRKTYTAHDGSTQTYIPPGLDWDGFQIVASALAPLCPGKTLLDIGCGGGGLASRFEAHGFRPYGIDISEFAVQNCLESMRGRLALGDITTCPNELWAYQGQDWEEIGDEGRVYPFPDQYDLVMATDLLEHLFAEDLDRTANWIFARSRRWLFFCVAIAGRDQPEFVLEQGASVPPEFETTAVSGHVNVKHTEWWAEYFLKKKLTVRWDLMYKFQARREEVPAWQATGGWGHEFTYILEKQP